MSFTGTVRVRDTDYPATYTPETESFSAEVDGKRIYSKSWSGLASAVNVELRKREVLVAVNFVHPETGRAGHTTRLHAAQRKPMITWAGGKKEVADIEGPLRPDTDVDELRRLVTAAKHANAALREFRDEHRFDGAYSLSSVIRIEAARVIAEQEAAERAEGAIELDA